METMETEISEGRIIYVEGGGYIIVGAPTMEWESEAFLLPISVSYEAHL